MQEIEISIGRDNHIAAMLFESKHSSSILIIASATGVKQSFYRNYASFIASNGITVITFDYQGIGKSLRQPINNLQNNAQDWGETDLEHVIQFILNRYPKSTINLLGHSIGGQLIGLAKSSVHISKIILVAAQSGYWKYWKGVERIKMWFNWYILFPILINIFGFMPSKKILGMENLPKNVAKQWSRWGRNKQYLFCDIDKTDSYYHKIKSELLAISIENDVFAPKEAVQWITKTYSAAKASQIHLLAQDYNSDKIGHFGIFKEKFKNDLWKLFYMR